MSKNFSSVRNPHRDFVSRLEAARFYHSRGYAVIPMPYGCKQPVIVGWQKLRLRPSEFANYFSGQGNIGILTGEPSCGLIDIDLDCDEAVELADKFLPHTAAVTGHAKRPRSHRWYFAHGLRSERFTDPVTKEIIAELRSCKLLSTVGPSLHPDGGLYDLLEAVPTIVPPFILIDAVRRLYAAVCERRGHFPRPARPRVFPAGSERDLEQYSMEVRLRRAKRYLRAVPGAVEDRGGHNQTFAAATAMVHGFALPPEIAFELLRDHYNPRCEPPWSDRELEHKVNEAFTKPHDMPKGWLLAKQADRTRKGQAG